MPRLEKAFLTKKKKADLIDALLELDFPASHPWVIQSSDAARARVQAVEAVAKLKRIPRGRPKYNKSFFTKKSVAELRAQCNLRGVDEVGTKPVLVDRLLAYNYSDYNQKFGVARPRIIGGPDYYDI
jgi:hypothetical protein